MPDVKRQKQVSIPQCIKREDGTGIHGAYGNFFPQTSFTAYKNEQEEAGEHNQYINGIAYKNRYIVKKPASKKHQQPFPTPGFDFYQICKGMQGQPCAWKGQKQL